MSEVRILFHNCWGLNEPKLANYNSMLQQNLIDIIILQEHWFLHFDSIKSSPFFITSSDKPFTPLNRTCRNGILLLASPVAKPRIHILKKTFNSLAFTFDDLVICTSYLQPSLSPAEISSELSKLPSPHLFIGDFNYRMGIQNNDKGYSTNTVDRRQAIIRKTTSWNVSWVKPDYASTPSLSSRTDHCFIVNEATCDIKVRSPHDFDIDSDHNMMFVNLVWNESDLMKTKANDQRLYRLYLRKLDLPYQRERFVTMFDTLCKASYFDDYMGQWIAKLTNDRQSRKSARQVLTKLNDGLTRLIWIAGVKTLGCYDVAKAKTADDNLLDKIKDVDDPDEAILMFKRAQRSRRTVLISGNDGVEPDKDAMNFFGNLWREEMPPDDLLETSHGLDLDVSITLDSKQIKSILMKYPASKSCGIDNIHVKMLKVLWKSKLFVDCLTKMFNLCLTIGLTPVSWNCGVTVLLPKKDFQTTAADTRPVSLTPMFRRLFEKCLYEQWESTNEAFIRLHDYQAGARKGYSAFSQALVNHDISCGRPITILLDIQKAFDSVRHKDLFRILKDRGIPDYALSLIKSLFLDDMRTRVVVNDGRSDEIKITRGIFQGSVLSPRLFMIWFDDLADQLNRLRPNDEMPSALFFVDDIVLKAVDDDHARAMLAVCDQWSFQFGVKFNLTKCVVMRQKRRNGCDPLLLYGVALSEVASEKYLGVPTSARGMDLCQLLDNQLDDARKTMKKLYAVGEHWPEGLRARIVKTFVISQLNYCAPAIGLWIELNMRSDTFALLRKKMEDLDDYILQFCFARRVHCTMAMRRMTQIDSIENMFKDARQFILAQLERFSESNPWHRMNLTMNAFTMVMGRTLVPRLSAKTLDFDKFEEARRKNGRHTLHDFKVDLRNKRFLDATGVMQHYVMDRSLKGKSKMDKVLSIRDHQVRRQCIEWRLNKTRHSQDCRICGFGFNRAHIMRCDYWLHAPAELCVMEVLGSFNDDHELLTNREMDKSFGYNGNYSVVDAFINNGLYEGAAHWMEWIGKLLNRIIDLDL